MLNNVFEQMRKKMTFTYAVIFGTLILFVVAATYALIWYKVLENEKDSLIRQIYHEAEEYVATGEAPVSRISIEDGVMLAYLVSTDEKKVLMDQMKGAIVEKDLKRQMPSWPQEDNSAFIMSAKGDNGESYHYLAGVAPVLDNDKPVARLYMFKNMDFYYFAAFETFTILLSVAFILFVVACWGGYVMSKKNIQPIYRMYEKQKQFTADASHEMRTPLAVMNLAVEGLVDDKESRYSEFAVSTLKMLHTEVKRLSSLTGTLMKLVRCDELNESLAREVFDIGGLCKNVTEQLALVAENKRQILEYIGPEKLLYKGNRESINMLLVILLDNAIKYSSDGTSVKLVLKSRKNALDISVYDEGIGISDQDKKKIFDRFFRVDKVRNREKGGLGLGLSLAQSIVNLHRGRIFAEDNLPRGTVMRVVLYKQQ